MPQLNRLQWAQLIKGNLKILIHKLSEATADGDVNGFRDKALALQTIVGQMEALHQSTERAAAGYLGHPAVRRTFMLAARELEATMAQMDDWMKVTTQISAPVHMSKQVSKILNLALELGRIEFSPPIPRSKPTQEQLAEIVRSETSETDAKLHKIVPTPLNPAEAAFLNSLKKGE